MIDDIGNGGVSLLGGNVGGFLGFFLSPILWQSYETALEMHQSMYRACCPGYGRPSSGFFSVYSISLYRGMAYLA